MWVAEARLANGARFGIVLDQANKRGELRSFNKRGDMRLFMQLAGALVVPPPGDTVLDRRP